MMYVDWAMCNALVEELCLFVSDCLRVSREKRENPLKFFFFFWLFFQVHMLWDSKYEGDDYEKKKIPVFVSKFGEIVFNFLFVFYFLFFSFYRFF